MHNDSLIGYMSDVQNFEKNMSSLSDKWELLTLLGSMSNIGMDTTATRTAFEELLDEPLVRLIRETFNKTLDELTSKAQSAIDILIRNLFERTADIGFLSTDEDVCNFLRFINQTDFTVSDDARLLKIRKKEALRKRFAEYVAKYSVYENIFLLDPRGKMLLQLDETHPVTFSKDPLVQESLHTHAGYVETFRATDLSANRLSLLYSYRVSDPETGEPIGVLCLQFRFEDELKSIFSKLKRDNPYINLQLLRSDGTVIASSAPHHVPVGSELDPYNNETHQMYFGGFEYLYKTVKTKGYQGYTGPGWIGHAMVPLHLAFRSVSKNSGSSDELFKTVSETEDFFPNELKAILEKAKRIQTELDVTVWNGNVQIANVSGTENPFAKSLLNEISKTGDETKRIFDRTVSNLNTAMLVRYMEDLKFQSSLAIDIMDRNLYERANDCRWWALTTTFRALLSQPSHTHEEIATMESILSYINGLYTVYTTMFVYDRQGYILAVSNPETRHYVGKRVGYNWAMETLQLETTQDYVVSGFEPVGLYEDRHTYVYNACIRGYDDNGVGGIGIVFDGEPQFKAMLHDVLPKNEEGEVKHDMFALFIDRTGTVLASSDPEITVGSSMPLPESVLQLSNGSTQAQIVRLYGHYYALGATCSSGYREFKHSDGYQNDVIALFLRPIGECQPLAASSSSKRYYQYPKIAAGEETLEISTFFVGSTLFAVESKNIVCSLAYQELTPILHSSEYNLGVINHDKKMIHVISLSRLMGQEKYYDKEKHTVIIVKALVQDQNVLLGLAVDSIYNSPEIPLRSISHYGNVLKNETSLTKAVIIPDRPEDFGNEMISIIDIQKVYTQLIQPYPRSFQRMA